ncbi:C-3 sterol dehydrogenase/C-4 decarboxylase-like protein [Trematosphaeria pertusa]|uniref:C-3 sterol dehydrogenase/C-4 decarboxylase-like protein n=1 Tax=Trematosphaeria pertusa TaxID=390896 RepID=A0A6A6IVP2_9PLEO|nr:C-3 sterol dehydrogenase/C-4 decarboxylase-like protein [Trematosphaeria pertusa]KAF2254484.1 C-3 sterol dehydrogenase/C-4 decarboxylase-like protein [Trematosphaeria pertusa]
MEDSGSFLGTVLVTGGCGFIGSFIAEAFAAEPSCSRIVAASRHPNRFRIPKAEYRACDITDLDQARALLDGERPRVIVHTVSPGAFAIPSEHYRVTYLGTKHLLKLAKEHPSVRAFVWTSSVNAVHLDPKLNHRRIDEQEAKINDWNSNASAYSRSKGATESLVLGFNTDATSVDFSQDADWRGKLLTTSLRVTGLFGPRDEKTIKEILHLTNTFATRIQIGPNELVHSWSYVESAADAHVDAAMALLDSRHLRPDMRVDGEAFFIADPEPMRLWDFSRAVWRVAGDEYWNRPEGQQRVFVLPFSMMITIATISEWVYWFFTLGTKRPRMTVDHFELMSKGCWFSIEKAKKRLGYRPVCGTEEGIRRSVKWFQGNGD